MDMMETTQVTSNNDENISQVQYPQRDFKTTADIQSYNKMDTTTYEDSANVYDVPLPATVECNNQVIINENILGSDQIKVHSGCATTTPSTEGNIEVEQDIIPVQQDDSVAEYSSISLQENVIVTTESSDITCGNETIINVNSQSSLSDTVQNESEINTSITETSSTDSIELSECKAEEKSLDSVNNQSDEHMDVDILPSFIAEVDESVSLPPAEAPILEQEDTSQIEEVIQKGEEEFITKSVSLNEIEFDEAPQGDVISTDEANIQYTILPPGENSVYQEDGTLVVEYPLHSAPEVNEDESQNSEGFLDSSQEIEFIETPQTEIKKVSTKEGKPPPKPKGRKSSGCIPQHIVGHQIDKPVQEVPNGKAILKPRLGVKIPYRNLSSQIVSTSELQQQIVERARQKQESQTQVDSSNSFAKKLTHRLAQSLSGFGKVKTSKIENNVTESNLKVLGKINAEETVIAVKTDKSMSGSKIQNPTGNEQNQNVGSVEIAIADAVSNNNITEKSNNSTTTSVSISTVQPSTVETSDSTVEIFDSALKSSTSATETSNSNIETLVDFEKVSEAITTSDSEKPILNIESNSDLIAILEGDGDESSPIMNIPKPIEDEELMDNSSEIKEIEKEISLSEQKNANPSVSQIKEKKFFKSRDSRSSDATREKPEYVKDAAAKVTAGSSVVAGNTKVTESKVSEIKNMPSKTEELKINSRSNIDMSKSSSNSKSSTKSTDVKKSLKDKEEHTSDKKEKISGKVIEVEPQLKPAMVLKTYTRKRKSNDTSAPEPLKKPLITPTPPTTQPDPKIDIITPKPPDVYITKSSRIIKKKVIWDPDEALPSVRNQSKILSKIEAISKSTPSPKTSAAIKISPTKSIERKVNEKDKQTDTPKSTKPVEKKVTKNSNEDKDRKSVSPEKQLMKKPDKTEVIKKIKSPAVVKSPAFVKSPSIVKSAGGSGIAVSSARISPGKSPKKSFKRLTEIDKLLMDEGAVNMLYDINNSDEQKRRGSSRTAVVSNDKAQNQKELMNRTQEIKNELTQGTVLETVSPKILRKKEGPPMPKKEMAGPSVVRKMSKDSSKSSVHSPPPSPAAFTTAEASRIIRRHSSSSFSSNDDLVQETLADVDEKEKEKHAKRKQPSTPNVSCSTVEEELIVVEKPVKERAGKKKATVIPEGSPKKKLKKDNVAKDEQREKPVEITVKSEPGNVTGELKTDPTKAFTVIKMNKHYVINLTYSGCENYLTVQLLKDLTVTLRELGRNKNCNAVSLHSQGPAFCLGLDYKGLVESSEDLRRKRAVELSSCIREFLKCLLNFPKVLVAGIKGDCVGFGVTMLPLFDMIVASDSASFCAPYGKLGCAPEAGFLLSIPFQSNHGLASELLYTTYRMNADEAQRRGLVTKLFWPEKFDTEFRTLLAHISKLSKTGLMATKKQLRLLHCQTTETALVNSCKTLIEFWISEECQKNFTNYNALTFDIDQ